MNRLRVFPLVLASLLAAFASAASAQMAAPSVGTDAIILARPAAATAHARSDAKATEIDRNCLQQTGSRIVARNSSGKGGKRCVAANGRVYSRDDIDRTGEIDIADALRKLDPSIH